MSTQTLHFPKTTHALTAIAEAVFATPQGAPPAERVSWAAREVDDILFCAGRRPRVLLRLMVAAIALLAPLFARRLRGLSRLTVEERVAALERMEKSGLAAAPVMAVKAILCVVYYEHPDSAREVGWSGCTPDPSRLPLLASAAAAKLP